MNTIFKKLALAITLALLATFGSGKDAWEGKWITATENQSESNTWIAFRKTFDLSLVPASALSRIAADSKYWLWINGQLIVFEGGLKRGPTPVDTYYDEVDIAPFLLEGKNTIAILLWYFGKEGFSHKSSGAAAMVFECKAPGINVVSDKSWLATLHRAYENTRGVRPNFRLPESNVRFDARRDPGNWYDPDYNPQGRGFGNAKEAGTPPAAPWNRLVKRPIPLWKDYGLKEYVSVERKSGEMYDTLVCRLPYNAQITPWFRISSDEGLEITMHTDHYYGGGPPNVRAEYMTKKGIQEYESLGWMNGHKVFYILPKEISVEKVMYRETGYSTEFTGTFESSDPWLNQLWKKAVRTLYVTMRDTYMDCPDRERAQWWGDVVNESGESFYALDPDAAGLTKKGILELINWQREDHTLFSPVPAGNWNSELPGQMLASVGYYGFWNYYLNTGDKETISLVFDGVKKYLDVWKLKEDGTLVERTGDWYWGDWGTSIDKQLLFNAWYYLALKGYRKMAEVLVKPEEEKRTQSKMDAFETAFNNAFWDGKGYRTKTYEGKYDDRAQALAVVSGLASPSKYPVLSDIFKTTFLASPYMEKYVLEALFLMNEPEYGLERMKNRFGPMVDHPEISTLWEGWGIGRDGYGGGSINHAWSGGGLTILAEYVCGLAPVDPAWKTIRIKPMIGNLTQVSTGNNTVAGRTEVSVKNERGTYTVDVMIPEGSDGIVCIPEAYGRIHLNGREVWNKREKNNPWANYLGVEEGYNQFKVKAGKWSFSAKF